MQGTTTPQPAPGDAGFADLLGLIDNQMQELRRTHEVLTGEAAGLRRELARANDELERSRRLAAVGEMAAGIAHEVRNPLASIRLYASMLEDDLAGMPEQREIVVKILRAVRGLDAVVGDVLLFSKEIKARPELVECQAIVARVMDECLGALAGVGASHEIDVRVGELEADPELVHRALVNLVRNAAEAMSDVPEGARHLALSIGPARFRESGAVVCRVEDTGPGFGEGIIERIFNPFFTTRNVGTGLGLSIVNRIAEAHAGIVRARNRGAYGSDPGGAVVELVIPAQGAATGESQEVRAA